MHEVYMRIHNIKFRTLTMESTLQNDHKFSDECMKLSLTKFRKVFSGTIDVWLPLGVVGRK